MKKFLSMALALVMACNFTLYNSGNIAAAMCENYDYEYNCLDCPGCDDDYVYFKVDEGYAKKLMNDSRVNFVQYDGEYFIIKIHKKDVKEIIEEKPSTFWKVAKVALWGAYAYSAAAIYYFLNKNLVKPNDGAANNIATINITDTDNNSVTLDVTKLNISDINKMIKNANKLNLTDVNNKSVNIDSTELLINLINNINGTATVNSATTTETNSNQGLYYYYLNCLKEILKGMVIRNNEFLNNQVSPMFNRGINVATTFLSKIRSFGKVVKCENGEEFIDNKCSPRHHKEDPPAQNSNGQPPVNNQKLTNSNDQNQKETPQASPSPTPLSKEQLEELQKRIDFGDCCCLGNIYDEEGKCLQPGGLLSPGQESCRCKEEKIAVIVIPEDRSKKEYVVCRPGYDLVNNKCIKSVNDLNTDASQLKNDPSPTPLSAETSNPTNDNAKNLIVPEQEQNTCGEGFTYKDGKCVPNN